MHGCIPIDMLFQTQIRPDEYYALANKKQAYRPSQALKLCWAMSILCLQRSFGWPWRLASRRDENKWVHALAFFLHYRTDCRASSMFALHICHIACSFGNFDRFDRKPLPCGLLATSVCRPVFWSIKLGYCGGCFSHRIRHSICVKCICRLRFSLHQGFRHDAEPEIGRLIRSLAFLLEVGCNAPTTQWMCSLGIWSIANGNNDGDDDDDDETVTWDFF